MTLEDLGWDATQAIAEGARPARVIMTRGPVSRLHDGTTEADAMVAGKLRHAAARALELPVVGDWVSARWPTQPGENGAIDAILPRRTLFVRRAPGNDADAAQALAANVDTAFLVMGLDADFNVRRLERYLALTWKSGAAPVVVLSKADLCADVDARVAAAAASAPGALVVPAVLTVAVPAELRAHVTPGKTIALLGSSGAGKSTLLNRLLAREAQKTAAVRRSDARGRHTTSHRQLFMVPGGGMVIDSPGLREIQLWEADEGLQAAFDDVEELAQGCRFRDCAHGEEPGCAVRDALTPERLKSYHKLRQELATTSAMRGRRLR